MKRHCLVLHVHIYLSTFFCFSPFHVTVNLIHSSHGVSLPRSLSSVSLSLAVLSCEHRRYLKSYDFVSSGWEKKHLLAQRFSSHLISLSSSMRGMFYVNILKLIEFHKIINVDV